MSENVISSKMYGNRDSYALSPHFERHMLALTGEGLESKSAIAAELAYRDAEIERLRAEAAKVEALRNADEWPMCERDAKLMEAASTEIEWLRAALKSAEAGLESLNGAHESLRQRFAGACGEVTRLHTALDEADDLLTSARPGESLESASADDWYDQVTAWRARREQHDTETEPAQDWKTMREHELRYIEGVLVNIRKQDGEGARESADDTLAWVRNRLKVGAPSATITHRGEVMNPPEPAAGGSEAGNLDMPQRHGTGAVPQGREAQATQHAAAPTLCDNCPPIGYPTDKTRCLPCPRRGQEKE